jgi:hypothetical protein
LLKYFTSNILGLSSIGGCLYLSNFILVAEIFHFYYFEFKVGGRLAGWLQGLCGGCCRGYVVDAAMAMCWLSE